MATRVQLAVDEVVAPGAALDAASFGKLYDDYLPRIYAFVARRVGDRGAAEELTAATFNRIAGAVRSGEVGAATFVGFLYRVASSAVVDHARRERRTIPPGVRASDRDQDGDRAAAESRSDEKAARVLAAAIDRNLLRRAMLDLPPEHRRVLIFRYLDGLESDDLAAALGCSRAAAGLLLHRALRTLRSSMDQEASDVA